MRETERQSLPIQAYFEPGAERELDPPRRPTQLRSDGPLPSVESGGRAGGARGASASEQAYGGGDVQAVAARGVSGEGQALPHLDRIQRAFGSRHDLSGVRAHVGGEAATASRSIGARAYATGSSVAFREQPDLHLAAHEAAHVVQQRAGVHLKGGVGESGDGHEQHADRVADAVVAGQSAAPLLDGYSPSGGAHSGPVQKKDENKPTAKPEIAANDAEMGKNMVDKMNDANGAAPYGIDAGIHYSYNFEVEVQRAGKPELWKDEYRMGHNASGHFVNPYENGKFMNFELKKGHSASEAVKAWLRGLTVAECNSSVVAMEIDTLRAAIGDKKFDQCFGSKDAAEDRGVNDRQRLRIKPGTQGTPVEWFMGMTDANKLNEEKKAKGEKITEEEFDEAIKPGEWYYFYNHPKYLLKHPGGAWQGENALYMGKNEAGERLWAGLGASNVTEDKMSDEMVGAYNTPRDKNDERAMKDYGIKKADGTYTDSKFDPKGGEFKDEVTAEDIKKDPAYSLWGTTRKGGFLIEAGISLDDKKVNQFRPKKFGGQGT